jgi:phage shock protein C
METTMRLRRSTSDRMVAGVASGIAVVLKVDPVIVRLGFVVLGLLNGSGVLLYLLMWLLIPSESSVAELPRDQVRENATELKSSVEDLLHRIKNYLSSL